MYTERPAMSRDGSGPICPDCGTREALESLGVSAEEQERNIPTVKAEATAPDNTNTNQPDITGDEGGKIMAKNLDELKAENPELAAALMTEAKAAVSASAGSNTPTASTDNSDAVSAAVQAEQKRIQEIDALACLYDADTVQEAKYGENACTAQEMTFRAAQKAAQQGQKHLSNCP